uniref:Uncharacterized protein n=1 Tax=Daphnia galeata TaxID=27404 RepID=A0A8J2WLS8_9CRUS|nr:unnamed protein product [Daphnia galeata]
MTLFLARFHAIAHVWHCYILWVGHWIDVCFTEESGSPFSVYETKFVELHEGVQYDKFDYSQKYRSEWPMNKKSKVSARYPCKVLRFSDSLLGLNALCKNLVDGSMTLKELEEERLALDEKVKDNGVIKKLTKTKEDAVDEVSDGDDKEVLRGKRKRTPSTKLKDSNFINSPLEKKNKAVSTKFVKRTATQKRKHSKEVGKKIIKELNRLEDDEEEKVVSSNSDANESNSSAEEDEIDDQDLLEQEMGIVPQSSFTQLNRAGLSDSSQFSTTSAFGQSDLSISYAENQTLQDQLTSCDAKRNELQELIRNYEAHARRPVKMGNFKSSTDEYSDDTVGQQFSESWKPLKTVHVPEVDNLRQNPSLLALKKTIPPTAGLNVESVSNVKSDPLTMHALRVDHQAILRNDTLSAGMMYLNSKRFDRMPKFIASRLVKSRILAEAFLMELKDLLETFKLSEIDLPGIKDQLKKKLQAVQGKTTTDPSRLKITEKT